MIKKIFFILIIFQSSILYSYENKIIIASTTSTYDSGLLTYLNKNFENKFNINVQVLALGTGQAIRIAKGGNAELLLVHHIDSENEFIKDGFGIKRYNLMYNDYILVGPKDDNNKCYKIETKLKNIYDNKFIFISRGDDSGTHKKELELWQSISLEHEIFDSWYYKVGQGMGNTLLITNEKKGYTLVDRGTWISFKRKTNLKIICEQLPPLKNQYGLILVNPKINSNLNAEGAIKYVNWLISDNGKELINNFKVNNEQLFFYNYK
tara:strand:- start:207 stop:1001 length:795 start_codon:yes stop_codon:yes gene_type:complete